MRQLNVHKLVSDLNDLCNTLVKEYDINCGGCCYVAYEIAKHLDRFHIGYELRVLNDYPINLRKSNRELDLISGSNACCHYYLVIYGGGSVNRGSFGSWYHTYVVTEINHRNINWLYRASSWNSVYKRKTINLLKRLSVYTSNNMGKPVKEIYVPAKVTQCPRCRFAVKQELFDYEKAIYKCTKCGNIHA